MTVHLELLVLRQELAVLRRQVPHPKTKREERLVLTVLQWLRPLHERLSSLFTPDTFRRWHRELVRRKWDGPHRINKRKTIPLQTQLVVWRLSQENPTWGYRRIQGELQKIGIDISATSIRRITAPKRRPGPKRDTWRQFMRSQASSIIACDLLTVESVKLTTLHVLFFIELHTRRVLIGGVTDGAANLAWATQIARNLSETREDRAEPIRFLVHDRDKRFGATFDEVFKAEGIEIVRTPWRAPKAKGLASHCTSWGWLGCFSLGESSATIWNKSRIARGRRLEEMLVLVVGLVPAEETGTMPVLDGWRRHAELRGDLVESEHAGSSEAVPMAQEVMVAA